MQRRKEDCHLPLVVHLQLSLRFLMSAQANQRISTLILNTMLRLQPEDFYLASRVWSNRSSSEPMSARRFSSAMRDNSRSSEYFATRMEQLYNEGTYYNKYSIASIMMMLVILTSAEAAHEPLALCLSALCLQLPVPLHQTLLRPTRSPLPIHNKTQNTKHKTQNTKHSQIIMPVNATRLLSMRRCSSVWDM
jgi:hypothetical protein